MTPPEELREIARAGNFDWHGYDYENVVNAACEYGPEVLDEILCIVEEKVTLGLTVRYKEGRCIGSESFVVEGEEVCIGQNINVMNENGGVIGEEAGGFLQSSTCLQKHVCLIAELNVDAEMMVGLDKVDDLPCKMMDIDDDVVNTNRFEPLDEDLHEGLSTDRHHCFGHSVGERFETCAKSGSENEGVHGVEC